jgi:hypothetical protein
MTFSSRPPLWLLALLGLWIAWLAVGVFPVAPLEGDEQGVISGATALARGETDYLDLAYLPAIQPGSYALLAAASRWTGLGVEGLFAFGTVAGAVLFAGLAARLLATTLKLPVWLTLASLLACQEVSAAAYYMNTTALGLWLTFLSLLLATRTPTWRTVTAMSLCLAVAGWIRIDCLLPAPAIPVLVWLNTRTLRTSAAVTMLVAGASLVLVFALYGSCGLGWQDLFGTYATRGAIDGWGPTLRALPNILSPVICALFAFGFITLVIRREWALLALIVGGCAATLPIYGTSLASTKYFYHLIPFFLIAALSAVQFITDLVKRATLPVKITAATACALIFVADQAVALQTSSAQFRRYTPEPNLAVLANLPRAQRPWRIVIGPGEMIPTADGFRLRGGSLFAPWVWHREKVALLDQLDRFTELLNAAPDATVYYSGWLPYQIVTRVLRSGDFHYTTRLLATNSMPYAGEWRHAARRVRTEYLAYRTSPYFDPRLHPSHRAHESVFFIGDLNAFEPVTELADGGQWQLIWPEHSHRFATFLRRVVSPRPQRPLSAASPCDPVTSPRP